VDIKKPDINKSDIKKVDIKKSDIKKVDIKKVDIRKKIKNRDNEIWSHISIFEKYEMLKMLMIKKCKMADITFKFCNNWVLISKFSAIHNIGKMLINELGIGKEEFLECFNNIRDRRNELAHPKLFYKVGNIRKYIIDVEIENKKPQNKTLQNKTLQNKTLQNKKPQNKKSNSSVLKISESTVIKKNKFTHTTRYEILSDI
jgi:hypothetical protein